jgi:hypothetical protein
MLLGKIIVGYPENDMKHQNAQCGKNAVFLMLTQVVHIATIVL